MGLFDTDVDKGVEEDDAGLGADAAELGAEVDDVGVGVGGDVDADEVVVEV